MKKYLSFFKLRFVMGMQYRAAALAGVCTQFFWGLMEVIKASMSCISWVVKITVVPCSLFCRFIKSLTASFDTASSPIVGSSRNNIRGLCRREAAISQRIRCPKDGSYDFQRFLRGRRCSFSHVTLCDDFLCVAAAGVSRFFCGLDVSRGNL